MGIQQVPIGMQFVIVGTQQVTVGIHQPREGTKRVIEGARRLTAGMWPVTRYSTSSSGFATGNKASSSNVIEAISSLHTHIEFL